MENAQGTMSVKTEAELMRGMLEYFSDTGEIYWRTSGKGRNMGQAAGTVGSQGYRQIRVRGKQYRAHRLAWLMHYGAWPAHQVDHINGERDDNRIENLRDVTQSINLLNQLSSHVDSSSNRVGVFKSRSGWSYGTAVQFQGRRKCLGFFKTEEEAAKVVREYRAKLLALACGAHVQAPSLSNALEEHGHCPGRGYVHQG